MAHSYTPGLKVTEKAIVRKERRLPLKGNVLVKLGDVVKADDIVATTTLPGDVERLNLAGKLGVPSKEAPSFLKVKIGDTVKKDEIIAESKGFFGFFKSSIQSPIDGAVESFSEITGMLTLRKPPKKVEIDAYVNGKVVKVIENEGIVLETPATFIQGIFGIGGEVKGVLKLAVMSPDYVLKPQDITDDMKGKILIGGSLVTNEILRACVAKGVIGIVAGGINDKELKEFLGEEIGVAITGQEEKGITVVVTEGFGQMSMAKKTFDILKKNDGKKASINGATQIRAGVLRPEVIVTYDLNTDISESKHTEMGMDIGSVVRIIRQPFFGSIGKVVGLPHQLQKIETEAHVRVLEFQFDDGKKIVLPRTNVELIEE
ncbi:TPA: hypothetical protein DCW38_05395 [candidate division WOR-3 bacterium]|jgi:transcription antitermination factor NusG|uniref:KOW domain-containing protein n=1 Tax=candidate division WOR-3 bacterium TaxID=2052148 RepID=A0A350HAN2_UNCW3|nr:hypothetical protein [candidate division WOR-3 bacterium]